MRLRSVSLLAFACACAVLYVKGQVAAVPKPVSVDPLTPAQYRRAAEQTFLTFPEWYLVFSPDEYATFIAEKKPSEFPFLGHVGQFWQGYRAIHDITRDDYPFNTDYHVMIWVIGISTTGEYGLKWLHEQTLGRVAEATQFGDPTEEDKLAAQVARDYVRFLDDDAWFNFDFISPIKRLWTEVPIFGPDPIRKLERRYYLTNDYAAKALYAVLLKAGSEASFGIEDKNTAVVIDSRNAAIKEIAGLKIEKAYFDGRVPAIGPRYQAFTPFAEKLALAGIEFNEICGNDGLILVSALVPPKSEADRTGLLFEQSISTQPGLKRYVYAVPVGKLAPLIRSLHRSDAQMEHIFDY